MLGETAGMVAPIAAAAKAPQIASGMLSLDDKAMDMARQGIESQMVRSGGIQPATKWVHGGHEPLNNGAFDYSKFGTGGFANLEHTVKNRIPAGYATTSEAHASQYGPVISEVAAPKGKPLSINAKKELTEWAKSEGFPSAQAMIDKYYDGSAYRAFDLDARINALAQTAAKTGQHAVVDFGDLVSTINGRRVPMGKVAAFPLSEARPQSLADLGKK
jgi:hypothetical protein